MVMSDLNKIVSAQFSHAATIVPVADVAQSAAFYRDKLGFSIEFTWQQPPTYAVLRGGEQVSLHLSQSDQNQQGPGKGVAVYVFVHDPDQLYAQYKLAGAPITTPIGNRDYHMRDFDVTDPDGNVLCFGCGTDHD